MTFNADLFVQAVNAFLNVLAFFCAFYGARILMRNRASWGTDFYSLGIGVTVLSISTVIVRSWFLMWRMFGGQGDSWMAWPNIAFLLTGLGGCALGSACILRVFAYNRYGHLPWILTVVVSVVAAASVYFLQN